MQIQLCKKSIERLGEGLGALVSELREREHTPVVKDCLDRCQRCDLGLVIANADGIPMSASTVDQLLCDLDTLAGEYA